MTLHNAARHNNGACHNLDTHALACPHNAEPDPYPGAVFSADFLAGVVRVAGQRAPLIGAFPAFSITRASTGAAFDLEGVLRDFPSGAPRLTNRGLLIEGARTNLILYCRDFTNAAWTKSSVTAALTQTGIDGAANSASLLTATGANGTALQAVTSGSAARVVSFYVKRVTGTGTVTITADGDATRTDITSLINSATWTRVSLAQTLANPSIGFKIATSGDAIAVDYAQLESAVGASSPILTTSASATRAGDAANLTYAAPQPHSIVAEFERCADNGAVSIVFQIDDGDATDLSRLQIAADDSMQAQYTAGSASQAAPNVGTLSVAIAYRAAARFGANDVQIGQGGVLGAADTSATQPAAPTNLRFGTGATANAPGFCYLRKLAIYARLLSDSELKAMSI